MHYGSHADGNKEAASHDDNGPTSLRSIPVSAQGGVHEAARLTAYAVAKPVVFPALGLRRIAREEIGSTADPALRLGKLFGTKRRVLARSASDYDMGTTRLRIANDLEAIETRQLERA
jgi:plasmid maintenance system antidote protein VapI